MIYNRNISRKQYQTALWFVRYLYRTLGLQVSANEHVHYYHGFQDAANRSGKSYPTYISGVTFAIALCAWQYNPNAEAK